MQKDSARFRESPILSFALFFSLVCFSPQKDGEAEELGNIMDLEETSPLLWLSSAWLSHCSLMSYQGFLNLEDEL